MDGRARAKENGAAPGGLNWDDQVSRLAVAPHRILKRRLACRIVFNYGPMEQRVALASVHGLHHSPGQPQFPRNSLPISLTQQCNGRAIMIFSCISAQICVRAAFSPLPVPSAILCGVVPTPFHVSAFVFFGSRFLVGGEIYCIKVTKGRRRL